MLLVWWLSSAHIPLRAIFFSVSCYAVWLWPVPISSFVHATLQAYALKQVSKARVAEQGQQKAVLNEMLIMKLLADVPAVVRMHDALEDNVSVYFVSFNLRA